MRAGGISGFPLHKSQISDPGFAVSLFLQVRSVGPAYRNTDQDAAVPFGQKGALAGGGAFSLYQTPPLLAASAALSKKDSRGAVLGAVMDRRQPGQHVPPKTFAPTENVWRVNSRLGGLLRLAEGRAQQGHPNLIESSPHKA